MVWAHTLGRPLQPVVRSTTERTVRRVSDPSGQVLLELTDDRVTAQRLLTLDGNGAAVGAPERWREIAVELGGGAAERVGALDAQLRRRGLRATSASTPARILGGAAPER